MIKIGAIILYTAPGKLAILREAMGGVHKGDCTIIVCIFIYVVDVCI